MAGSVRHLRFDYAVLQKDVIVPFFPRSGKVGEGAASAPFGRIYTAGYGGGVPFCFFCAGDTDVNLKVIVLEIIIIVSILPGKTAPIYLTIFTQFNFSHL